MTLHSYPLFIKMWFQIVSFHASKCYFWIHQVWHKRNKQKIPGMAPTLHALFRFKLLMRLLLPTLGKPTTPTRIDVLTSLLRQSLLRSDIRVDAPTHFDVLSCESELFSMDTFEWPSRDDWFCVDDLKAITGSSPRKYLTQLSRFSLGTWRGWRENYIKCFWLISRGLLWVAIAESCYL